MIYISTHMERLLFSVEQFARVNASKFSDSMTSEAPVALSEESNEISIFLKK